MTNLTLNNFNLPFPVSLTLPLHFNLLFPISLVSLFSPIIYVKRSINDISDNNNDDDQGDDINDELEDITRTKFTIKDLKDKGVIDRVEQGLPVRPKDFSKLQEIKEEYESYFDKESGNSLNEGIKEVEEYLDEELESLTRNISDLNIDKPVEEEGRSKKTRVDDDAEEFRKFKKRRKQII
jgi:hypothetical protein